MAIKVSKYLVGNLKKVIIPLKQIGYNRHATVKSLKRKIKMLEKQRIRNLETFMKKMKETVKKNRGARGLS